MKSHASINRIYRLIWSPASSRWVAVAENVRGRGKSSCGARLAAVALALAGASWGMPSAYAADAANARVSAGAAGISTVGNTTTINQASQRVAIDWTGLSTRANEALVFNQPNASAIALNRITGSSPSELLGSLTANGQVFILNPNGVLFGAGSQVNVGGLVASTLNMSNADFMAGKHVFTGSGGSVVNQGTLNAGQGGYLALLAPEVRNEGVMTASLGTALLAAGNKVTLNLDNGSLLGYSIDQGAIKALAENRQLIQADGGQVLLSAKAMDSLTTATVNNTGVIEARTIQNKAGRILLMGDMETGTVNAGGTLDASAPNGGDGGFVETSAAHVKVADSARVTTLAAGGKHGTWLIDPMDFTVADSGGDISGAALGANLGTGNVLIQSVNGAAGVNGDVNVNSAVSWNAGTTLTLNAVRNININASITSQHADGKFALEYGQGAVAAGNASDYIIKAGAGINLAAGQNFSTRLGSDGVQKNYTVITSLGAEGSVTGVDLQGINADVAGNYALGGDIDAAATSSWESGAGFMPIANGAQFTGTLAGLGHKISNLTIKRTTNSVGLISDTEAGALVRDVGLVNANVTGNENVGALMGRNDAGVINNSYATGSVEGTSWVSAVTGGLVGLHVGGTIKNSYSAANVVGNGVQVGGLVGLNWAGTIDGSYATGNVTSDTYNYAGGSPSSPRGHQVGGLIGNNHLGTVINSYATGNVRASGKNVGGLVGTNETGTITNSHATGSVTAGASANVSNSGERVGGLVGENYSGTISNSYATGNVSGIWIYFGGLVGYNNGAASRPGGTILNSYATGNVNGVRWVGGLVGYDNIKGVISNSYATGDVTGSSQLIGGLLGATTEGTISNTYATGRVTLTGPSGGASDYIGGLVGANTRSTVTNSYWDMDTSGQSASASGTGLSTAQFQQQASFGGLDFSNTWVIYEGHTSPLLRSFMKALTVTANVTKVYDGAAYAFNAATDASYSLVADPALLNGTLGNSGASEGAVHVSQSGSAITLGGLWSGQQGYLINYANSALTITPKTITVAATGVDKVYNGDAAATVTLAGTGVIAGDVVNFSSTSANFSDKNAGTGKTVTVSGISVGGAGAGDYSLGSTSASTTADITRKAITVTATADNKTYDGNTAASVVLASSGVVGGDVVSFGNTAASFADKNAGTAKAVTVSGISASGADAGNYSLNNSSAGATADITQKAITVTATAASKTYDGNVTAGVALASSGVVGGDVVNFANTAASFADKNAGTSKAVTVSGISASGADAGNYSFNGSAGTTADITPKALTVSGVTAANKVYDQGTNATVDASGAVYTGLIGGDVVNVSTTGAFTDKNVANGKTVNLSSSYIGADVGNYSITSQATTTADITPKALTVSGVTAANKVYDQGTGATVSTAGAVYTGLISGDAVTLSATGSFTDRNVANGKTVNLNSSYTGADVGNYTITNQATTTADITPKALTVSGVTAANKVYDQGTGATVSTAGAVYTGLIGGDVVTVSATGVFTDKNAANGKTVNLSSSYTGADVGNYTITNQATTTADITPKALTVSGVTAANKVYDQGTGATVNTSGAVYTGLIGGDAVTVSATGTFTDKNVANGKTVNLSSSYTGADVGNYTITNQAATTADITPKALTVSGVTAANKVYDQGTGATVNTSGAVYTGLIGGDAVTVSATGTFTDKNVANGKTVNLSSSYTGADVGNYTIISQATTTADITPKALSISGISAANKVYDQGTSATVNTTGAAYAGLIGGDAVTVSATGAFTDKNAANSKTVNLSSSYTGADVGNYTITSQATTTADITPKALNVTVTGVNKVYDGTTAASVAYGDNRIAGDSLSIGGNAVFADKNAGHGIAVGVTGIALGGADAGNYSANSSAGTTADITPKALTVTANNETRLLDGVAYTGGNGVSYSGLVAGETPSVLGGPLAYGGTSQGAIAPGRYSITPGGVRSGNYTLSFVGGVLTIEAADATIAALGGPALAGAYESSKNTNAGLSGFRLSQEGGSAGVESTDALLNAAATATREEREEREERGE